VQEIDEKRKGAHSGITFAFFFVLGHSLATHVIGYEQNKRNNQSHVSHTRTHVTCTRTDSIVPLNNKNRILLPGLNWHFLFG